MYLVDMVVKIFICNETKNKNSFDLQTDEGNIIYFNHQYIDIIDYIKVISLKLDKYRDKFLSIMIHKFVFFEKNIKLR